MGFFTHASGKRQGFTIRRLLGRTEVNHFLIFTTSADTGRRICQVSGVFGSPTRPASRSVSSRQREGIPRRYLCTRHTGTWPFQRLASLAAVDWPHRGARRRAAAPGPSAPWAARTRGGVRPSSHGSAAPDLQRRAQRGLKDGSRRGAEASARASAEGAQAKSAVARASVQSSSCKKRGGYSICQRQRRRSTCKKCGGSSICQHQRIRSRCKECRGASICHLPAPAPEEQMQEVRGREHLPAPAPKERLQGVRGRGHLSAPAPTEQAYGLPRGSGQVDAGRS